MKQFERVNYLLGKYVRNAHTPAEGQELFDLLKEVKNPEYIDQIFQGEWNQVSNEEFGHLLSWQQLMQELDSRKEEKVTRDQKTRKTRISLWKWGVAASVLVIVAFAWWLIPRTPMVEIYETGYGETREIVLDDGTEVILNANSSLVWHHDLSQDASGTKYRLAELTGEAFFNVSRVDSEGKVVDGESDAPQDHLPFKVMTSDLTINVLGTAFNVMTWRGKTEVYLDHGAVQLDLFSSTTMDKGSDKEEEVFEKVIMKPGDMVSFSASTRDLHRAETENPERFTEWKEGTLVFENVLFGSMLNRLEDIYGKEFIVSDSTLMEVPVSFGLPYENWETVTNLMEVTLNIKLIEEQNNKIRVKNGKVDQ